MKGFHIAEVFLLSLLAPAVLGFLIWQDINREESRKTAGPGLDWKNLKSRTRVILVFEGELQGYGKIRVFEGVVPGIDQGFTIKRINERLCTTGKGMPLTLLLWNYSKKQIDPFGRGWVLEQEGKKKWFMKFPIEPRTKVGKLYSSIFTPPGESVPPGKLGRYLFVSPGNSRLLKAPLILKRNGLETSLKPTSMPSDEVFSFPEVKKG